MKVDRSTKWNYVFVAAVLVLLGVSGYYGWQRYVALEKDLANKNTELSSTLERLGDLQEERDYIYNNLLTEQAKNNLFEEQIKQIAGTVGDLDKLSKTDEELLQKYSRVYFLNEHYVPEALATITPEYVFEQNRVNKIHAKVLPFLNNMIKAAQENATPVQVVSSYRSFGEQSALKGSYLITYGSGANKFSADQGYSEHQLGTTLDFTTPKLGSSFTQFADTLAYKWLTENAYKYGFTLSYPDGNSYYQFEPWHWRFVGEKLALRLHNENENFYDVDQRIINNYLLTIFD